MTVATHSYDFQQSNRARMWVVVGILVVALLTLTVVFFSGRLQPLTPGVQHTEGRILEITLNDGTLRLPVPPPETWHLN